MKKTADYKKIIVGIILLVALISGFSLLGTSAETELPCQIISIGETRVRAEVATTEKDRVRGLSGRLTLPAGTGMLFVFERPGLYSFWMKDMKFPIDIIWINKEQKIVGAIKNVPPESFPETFMPPASILYALEVPAGFVKNYSLTPGMPISLSDC